MRQDNNDGKNVTGVGTDIDDVKRKNDDSGMSYNEAKAFIAKTTGGHHTKFLSNTDVAAVKEKNQQSMGKKS